MATVALVPARGGSRGVPGKNLRRVGGASLVARAIAVADGVDRIRNVVVSSDDKAILAEARRHGAQTLLRPPALATDDATTLDVVRHFLDDHPGVRVVVLLQPTSPLRTTVDVERSLDALDEPPEVPCVTTVTARDHPPGWIFTLDDDRAIRPVLDWDALASRRQDAVPSYELNGAVYVARASYIADGGSLVGPGCRAVEMPFERAVDIDAEVDLVIAEALAGWS